MEYDSDVNENEYEELVRKKEHIDSIISATFGTPSGSECLDHLIKTFVERKIYRQGSTLEDTSYRQGQSDLISSIVEIARGDNGR